MIKFNMVTMKDGKIHVEEKKDLSNMLSDVIEEKNIDLFNTLEEEREKHVNEVFKQRMEKVKKTKLAPGFYLNNQNSEFFTGNLESMVHTITDEGKKWKIEKRLKEGKIYGTFRRFKTTQPTLVKSYKTRKGAEQNTFWRNN